VESNKVRATYNKAILLSQRREMMQAWADYLAAAEDSALGVTDLTARPAAAKSRERSERAADAALT